MSGKPTEAPRATLPDEAGRTNTGPRGTPVRHAARYNQGTRTGAKQQRPTAAAKPDSAHNTQRTAARRKVTNNTSRRPDGLVRARQQALPLPATEEPPSGLTCARSEGTQPLPATKNSRPECAPRSDAPHTQQQHNTVVNRSQVAKDTAHATLHRKQAHRCTGAKWPRTPQTQPNTPRKHTGEQEPSGPGHRTPKYITPSVHSDEQRPSSPGHSTHNTRHRACTPVNKSQVAKDTAHATQHTERAHL